MNSIDPLARRRALVQAGLGLFAGSLAAPLRAQGAPTGAPTILKLGLTPFFSPTTMLKVFRPMRDHLAQALGLPVEAYTARDSRDLIGKVRAQEYDVVLAPAHVAQMACTEWLYVPAAATPRTPVLLLVRKDSAIRSIEELKGKRFGGNDRFGIVSAAALAWLRTQGIDPDRDLEYVMQATGNGSLYALSHGDIEVCAISGSQLLDMPPDTPRDHRVLKQATMVLGPVYIARAALGEALLERLRAALFSFEPNASAPPTNSNSRLRPLSMQDLAEAEPYTQELRRALQK